MKKIALATLLLVSGCIGLHDEPVYFKDNHQVYRAVCNGMARDIGDCYALADKRCGGGFEVIEKESEEKGSVNSEYKTTNFDRQSNRRTELPESISDAHGKADTWSNDIKLKLVNRSIYFYCK